MTDDIVTRLREQHANFRVVVGVNQNILLDSLYTEAANEIERLRAERLQWFLVARQLRDALLGAEDTDAAFDEYLRTRGRLEDPREQAEG